MYALPVLVRLTTSFREKRTLTSGTELAVLTYANYYDKIYYTNTTREGRRRYGWHHVREFDIFKHTDGNYHLLCVTGDGTLEDQQVRGLWCATLTDDWNADGTLISSDPLIDVTDYTWVTSFVEITRLQVGGRLLLYFGATRR